MHLLQLDGISRSIIFRLQPMQFGVSSPKQLEDTWEGTCCYIGFYAMLLSISSSLSLDRFTTIIYLGVNLNILLNKDLQSSAMVLEIIAGLQFPSQGNRYLVRVTAF